MRNNNFLRRKRVEFQLDFHRAFSRFAISSTSNDIRKIEIDRCTKCTHFFDKCKNLMRDYDGIITVKMYPHLIWELSRELNTGVYNTYADTCFEFIKYISEYRKGKKIDIDLSGMMLDVLYRLNGGGTKKYYPWFIDFFIDTRSVNIKFWSMLPNFCVFRQLYLASQAFKYIFTRVYSEYDSRVDWLDKFKNRNHPFLTLSEYPILIYDGGIANIVHMNGEWVYLLTINHKLHKYFYRNGKWVFTDILEEKDIIFTDMYKKFPLKLFIWGRVENDTLYKWESIRYVEV